MAKLPYDVYPRNQRAFHPPRRSLTLASSGQAPFPMEDYGHVRVPFKPPQGLQDKRKGQRCYKPPSPPTSWPLISPPGAYNEASFVQSSFFQINMPHLLFHFSILTKSQEITIMFVSILFFQRFYLLPFKEKGPSRFKQEGGEVAS